MVCDIYMNDDGLSKKNIRLKASAVSPMIIGLNMSKARMCLET